MNTKLTAKETALMTAIADNFFSFWDQGLVHGSGMWTECMTEEVAGSTKYDVSATQRGVASVINSLGKKGLLITDTNEDGAWTDLSPAGEELVKLIQDSKGPGTIEVELVEVTDEGGMDLPETTVEEDGSESWTDEDGTEWNKVTFLDGSHITTRRRRHTKADGKQVWKINRWAAEFEGDTARDISSAQAKAAHKAGRFTRG